MGEILAPYQAGRPRNNLGRERGCPRFVHPIWFKNLYIRKLELKNCKKFE